MLLRLLLLLAITTFSSSLARAQFGSLTLEGKPVEIHGFASQGFAVSDGNNYLTMKTSSGSFAFTDLGGNIAIRITPKLRIGAQIYDRNIGKLGNWHPTLDWASIDYRFNDWFGVRLGKVKTVMGLYNDTQDLEFLHPWALMPQSLYPLDLRSTGLAHTGGDFYGNISLGKGGVLSYTAYAGLVPFDQYGGNVYGVRAFGVDITKGGGRTEGGDLRWSTPIGGLTAGISYANFATRQSGTIGPERWPHQEHSRKEQMSRFYAQYERGPLKIDTEYGQYLRDQLLFDPEGPPNFPNEASNIALSGYGAVSYRVSPRLEFGSYYSAFFQDARPPVPAGKTLDKVVTASFDLTSHWDFTVEGHFIAGHAAEPSARGFYWLDNPQGLKPHTNLLVIRTSFEF